MWLLTQIYSIEIVIASGPSFSIGLHCLFAFGQISLSDFEFLFSVIHLWDIRMSSSLEGLINRECLLEVHPVL